MSKDIKAMQADKNLRHEAYYAHSGNIMIDYDGREWSDFNAGWDAAIQTTQPVQSIDTAEFQALLPDDLSRFRRDEIIAYIDAQHAASGDAQRVAELEAAIRKHKDPAWECNSDHPALAAVMRAPAPIADGVAGGWMPSKLVEFMDAHRKAIVANDDAATDKVVGQIIAYLVCEYPMPFARRPPAPQVSAPAINPRSSIHFLLCRTVQDFLVKESEFNSVEFDVIYSRKTEQEIAKEIYRRVHQQSTRIDEIKNEVLEEAATICDNLHHNWRWDEEPDSDSGPRSCAAAIRAKKSINR